jgi:hypothetical protein
MILFARPQRHPRHRTHGIIGVSLVSRIAPKGDDRKTKRRILPAKTFADFQLSFRDTGGTPMLLFARPQRHPRHRTHRIIGVSPVSRIPAKGDDRKTNRRILPAKRFADFQPSFRDTGGTLLLLFARSQRHPRRRAQGIIGVSPVSRIAAKGDDRRTKRRILPAIPFADFQLSFRDTGGTPMLLFARPQRHPLRRAHRIIGVSPVSRIAPKGDDRRTKRRILHAKPFADFQLSCRDTGGTPMLLFARSQRHPRRRAHRSIGVSPVSRIAPKGDDRRTKRRILPAKTFADFQPSFRDTGGTPMLLFARPQRHPPSPSPSYHRRLACLPDCCQGRRSKD